MISSLFVPRLPLVSRAQTVRVLFRVSGAPIKATSINLRVIQEGLSVADAKIVLGGTMPERMLARDGFNSLSPFAWGIRLLPGT